MKVECISDFEHLREQRVHGKLETYPVKGQIYTIRQKHVNPITGWTGYRLVEIVNPILDYRGFQTEAAFGTRHFRPITDISVFTKLTKVRELEDA